MFFVYFPEGNYRFIFAWFQATSAVQISASSSSTTISVSKPDDVEAGDPTLYAYNANFTEDGGAYDNHGYNTAVDPNKVSMLLERGSSIYSYQTSYVDIGNTGGLCIDKTDPTITYTKVIRNGVLSIIPEAGFEISSITFDTLDEDHAKALAKTPTSSATGSRWENGTPARSEDKVTVTPIDGNRIISVTPQEKGIKLEGVTIHYAASADSTWNLTQASFAFVGGVRRANAVAGTNYDNMAWVTAEDPARVTDTNYFTQLTNSNKEALLNSSKLAPGYKLSYAAKLVVSAGSPTNASFYLKKYTSTQLLNRYILNSASESSGNPIEIDRVIKICTSINTTGWFFGSSANQFSYATVAADSTTTDTGGNIQTKVFNSEAVGSAYSPDELGTFENFTSTTIYFFFTIEFSNEPSTDFYDEYTAVSGTVTDTPRSDYKPATTYVFGTKYYTKNSGGAFVYDAEDQPSSLSDINTGNYYLPTNRYFLKHSTGTSNCYAGLTFQINKIELALS